MKNLTSSFSSVFSINTVNRQTACLASVLHNSNIYEMLEVLCRGDDEDTCERKMEDLAGNIVKVFMKIELLNK